MPPNFTLSIHSVNLPALPQQAPDLTSTDIRSPQIPSSLSATSPLVITFALPLATPKNALHPATHLQLTYHYPGTGEIFLPQSITSKALVSIEDGLFELEIPPKDVLRAKVNHGESSTAEVWVYAWKGEKLLGKWRVCEIEGLGIEGLKSGDLARLRVETWREMGLS